MTASVSVPVGTVVNLTANPHDSRISVNGNSIGSTKTWKGTATLPRVGLWSIGLTIGSETCTIKSSAYPKVVCMVDFVSDGAGGCKCPSGKENKDGVCTTVQPTDSFNKVCQDADVKVGADTIEYTNAELSKGTKLRIKLDNKTAGDAEQYDIKLSPVAISAKSMTAVTDVELDVLGTFDVQIVRRTTHKLCYLRERINVIYKCAANELKTTDGACVEPKVQASVESNTISMALEKENNFLDMPLSDTVRTIQLAPSGAAVTSMHALSGAYIYSHVYVVCTCKSLHLSAADYNISWNEPILKMKETSKSKEPAWARLGKVVRTSKTTSQATVTVYFNTSGIPDGTELHGNITFGGTASSIAAAGDMKSLGAAEAFKKLSVVVRSAPSLVHSPMTFDQEEPIAGQKVTLFIDPKDSDGLPITHARGRFIQIAWSTQMGNRDARTDCGDAKTNCKDAVFKDGRFVVEFSSLDLSEPGDHYIWVSHKCVYCYASRETPPYTHFINIGYQNFWTRNSGQHISPTCKHVCVLTDKKTTMRPHCQILHGQEHCCRWHCCSCDRNTHHGWRVGTKEPTENRVRRKLCLLMRQSLMHWFIAVRSSQALR